LRLSAMKFRRLATLAALILLIAPQAGAQSYPAKPVRFVVPFPPGGTTDILARLVGQKLSESWGQQFVIDNRPGAGGNIGADIVAKATPDGYTILMGTPGTQAINQYVYKTMPYDTAKDFAPVSMVALVANVIAVSPNMPAKTLPDLIAMAKAKPGSIDFGTPGNGTTGHLSTELLKSMAGIDLVHVPYKGSAFVLQDLMADRLQMMLDNLPSALQHIQSGAIRALAVTTEKRWFALPDVPTVAEAGVPGYEAASWFCVVAPAKTPPEIVARLSGEIDRLLKTADMRQRFRDVGAEPVGGKPEQLGATIASEMIKWKKVVEVSGARLE
jgi:tripartite-type tricarboxylate transporter receptor subunit TctC